MMLNRFVPPLLKNALMSLRALDESQRRVIRTEIPLRAYVNPHVWPGSRLLATGHWEADTERILKEHLKPGDIFLDIGANEGILSAYGGTLVGAEGMVIAVEPQSKLVPYIEVNLALNDVRRCLVYNAAFGRAEGERLTLNLYPNTNNGQSSFIKKPRFGWTTLRRKTEEASFVSPERILNEANVSHFDLIKVDVEGFEVEVVEVLLPLIRRGAVKKLLLDYHEQILKLRNIEPRQLHESLLNAGLTVILGDGHLRGDYTLYGIEKVSPEETDGANGAPMG